MTWPSSSGEWGSSAGACALEFEKRIDMRVEQLSQ
jgi:hypothetical protein